MATPIDLHAVAELELEARSRYPWRIKACTSTACQLAGARTAFEIVVTVEDVAGNVVSQRRRD